MLNKEQKGKSSGGMFLRNTDMSMVYSNWNNADPDHSIIDFRWSIHIKDDSEHISLSMELIECFSLSSSCSTKQTRACEWLSV